MPVRVLNALICEMKRPGPAMGSKIVWGILEAWEFGRILSQTIRYGAVKEQTMYIYSP